MLLGLNTSDLGVEGVKGQGLLSVLVPLRRLVGCMNAVRAVGCSSV